MWSFRSWIAIGQFNDDRNGVADGEVWQGGEVVPIDFLRRSIVVTFCGKLYFLFLDFIDAECDLRFADAVVVASAECEINLASQGGVEVIPG